jgi:hypothetical protein
MRNVMLSLVAALFAAVPATTDRIDDIIIEQMKVSHLPGVAVAIVDHGRVTISNPGEPLRSGFGKALIQAVGPLNSVTLVRIEDDGTRVYRLAFQRKQWDWIVKVDSTGRIADMRPAT